MQRWLRFIPRLIAQGYELTVITSKDGDYPFIDESLCDKLPKALKVIRVKAPKFERLWNSSTSSKGLPHGKIPTSQKGLSKLLVSIRLNLVIPDLKIFWNPALFQKASNLLSEERFDALISTGPPHSSHLAALILCKRHKIKWFADFRDPFSRIHYLELSPPSPWAMRIYKRLEKKVIEHAKASFVVSEDIADKLPEGKKIVIHNGFDPLDFKGLEHQTSDVLRIKYIGQFTEGQSLKMVNQFLRGIKRKFKASFIGTKLRKEEALTLSAGVADKVFFTGFLPHHQALKEMVDSELLLLIINDYPENEGMLTTKLFEYLASRTPIIAFGPKDNAAIKIIRDTEAGYAFEYDELREAVNLVEELPLSLRTKGNIDKYSVDYQVNRLIEELR